MVAGDRYKRELTTILPELPQGDMNTDNQLVPITDPCYPFVNISNKQFFSPGYPSETYTNNTDCVLVLEGEFYIVLLLYSLIRRKNMERYRRGNVVQEK